MSGTQDYIQLDLLGLIAAGFTNVKFQMGSTEGGAYSSAGVSGSAHAPPMRRLWWVAMEPLTWPMNLSARNHYLGFLRDQGERTAGRTSAFRSTQCSGALIAYALLLAGMLGLAGVSFARRLATQKA